MTRDDVFEQLVGKDYGKINNLENELVVRKGKIYSILGPKDDRLQVQIFPDLQGIPNEELDNLPKYPPFFKNTFTPGRTIKDDGDDAEWVWCLCTRDLQVGFVLGLCDRFPTTAQEVKASAYSFKNIEKYLAQRMAKPKNFNYNNLVVKACVQSDEGGMVEMYDRITGDWFLLNSTGAIITVQQSKVYIRVGSPPNPISDGPVSFSAITMETDKIKVQTKNFELKAENTMLGNHGLQLGGVLSTVVGMNYSPVIPCDNISV